MTATVSQIRTGLATRLATISGLRAAATWPDQINCPQAIVKPLRGAYHDAMGSPGYTHVSLEVVLLIAPTAKSLTRGQDAVDTYLDPTGGQSIKAAIEADVTLGGIATTLIVSGWRDYGSLVVGEVDYIGATFDVDVWP